MPTLTRAVKDLGWFPALMTTVVGGPSVLSIIQTVLEGFRLNHAFQWIVDGYNQLTAILAQLVEPYIVPVIAWINGMLGWKLTLHAHWRPLFMVCMIVVVATVRAERLKERGEPVSMGLVLGVGAFAGAVLIGLIPPSSAWWVQGLVLAGPLLGIVVLATLLSVAFSREPIVPLLQEFSLIGIVIAGFAFGLPAVLHFVFGLPAPGMILLAVLIALLGAGSLAVGLLSSDIANVRYGLTILGGFLTAAAIVVADRILDALT